MAIVQVQQAQKNGTSTSAGSKQAGTGSPDPRMKGSLMSMQSQQMALQATPPVSGSYYPQIPQTEGFKL